MSSREKKEKALPSLSEGRGDLFCEKNDVVSGGKKERILLEKRGERISLHILHSGLVFERQHKGGSSSWGGLV